MILGGRKQQSERDPKKGKLLPEVFEKPVDDKAFRQAAPDPMFPKEAGADRASWEYRTVLASDTAELGAWGAEGWELVAVNPRPGDQALFYFRRPKRGGAA